MCIPLVNRREIQWSNAMKIIDGELIEGREKRVGCEWKVNEKRKSPVTERGSHAISQLKSNAQYVPIYD